MLEQQYGNQNPQDWKIKNGINYVDRSSSYYFTEENLLKFMADFFHFENLFPSYLKQLEKIEEVFTNFRNNNDARFYSCSIVFSYDEDDPTKFECRVLDFSKVYFNVSKIASSFNEDIDDCEDSILLGIHSIHSILDKIYRTNYNHN